jgi:opacity protein-like surface antigen
MLRENFMHGQRLLLAVISGAAALSIGSSAQALQMSAPDGWYLEANGGPARLSNGDGQTSKNGLAYNLNLGYKFMPYVGLEAGYTKYKNSKIVVDDITYADISRYSWDIALKGMFPITDTGVELIGKLGAQYMKARAVSPDSSVTGVEFSDSTDATGPYYGLGIQFNVMSELGIVVQWQRAQGNNNTGTEDLFSVGINFIFV